MLFLGAGASLASGMPTTIEMTTEILSGGEPDPGPSGNERVEAIVRFLPTI
jgi:hypothetical protein